jgi:hypothetical protein
VKTIAHGASRQVTGIPTGNHRFRYTVTDNCGNTTVQECAFRVVDLIEPTAICNNQLNISLGGNGQARVFATDINEGSNDNCGAVLIKVRRQPQAGSTAPIAENTPWSDFVDFSCADAATSATPNRRVRVELRVWDDANRNGVAGDAGDLFSTCWLDVLVEDKVRPVCYAPHAMTVSCDALPANFTATDTVMLAQLFNGTNPPSATDNCSATVRELTPIVNLHDCGWGTIRRRFQATDSSGNTSVNTCEQVSYDRRKPQLLDQVPERLLRELRRSNDRWCRIRGGGLRSACGKHAGRHAERLGHGVLQDPAHVPRHQLVRVQRR